MDYLRSSQPVQTAVAAAAESMAGLLSASIAAAEALAFVTFVMCSAVRAGFASFAEAVFN